MSLASIKALREMGGSHGAIASITHGTTLQSIARRVESVCTVLLAIDTCRLCTFDAQRGLLNLVRSTGSLEIPVKGVTGLVATTGSCVRASDLTKHEFFEPSSDCGHKPQEGMPIPTLAGPCRDGSKGTAIEGVVCIQRVGGSPFTAEDEDFFKLICLQVPSCRSTLKAKTLKAYFRLFLC